MKIDESKKYYVDFKSEEAQREMWVAIKCKAAGSISGMDSTGRKHDDPEAYIQRIAKAIEAQFHALSLYEDITLPGGFEHVAHGCFLAQVESEMGLLKYLTIRELAE